MRAFQVGIFVIGMCGAISCSDAGGDAASGGGAGMAAASGASGESSGGSSGTPGSGGSSAASSGGAGGAGAGGGSGGSAGQTATELIGYWVWEQKIENGAATLTVTDADMESKVGPSGWPGCPEGILCTKHGIQKLAFGPQGEFWRMNNVTTGSDSNLIGTYSVDGATVSVIKERSYSCAHPEQNDALSDTGYFRWKLEGDRLWVSQPMHDQPPNDPSAWLVLKPVSEADFYGKYMVRICQDYGKEPKCYPGCFSNDYGK